ncbi:MAG: hypothetical protein FJZ47_08185 [Candidatus Tectomicrobia bacterium]|uniref:Uncharacterized protein n=1 Tax=Tectimicrobiota bacterium TaxID=2528274 RepID=A0A937VZ42_UNCTE|nr:hypothetical protein [Candidatus Tectomicrobia bacterium]
MSIARSFCGEQWYHFGGKQFQGVQHLVVFNTAIIEGIYQTLARLDALMARVLQHGEHGRDA